MEMDPATVKGVILSEGIDLVGFADARDLVLAFPPRPATDLLPTARTVIVMAVAHSLGAVYSSNMRLWTRNKMQTSRLLDQVAEKTGRLLEREGYLSLPVSADKPVDIYKRDPSTGKKLRHSRTAGQLSLKHAAVSCGMGEIGRSNLLLTKEFGPHQRLGAVITEAYLQPDPRQELGLCTSCNQCAMDCPVGALRDGHYEVDRCFAYWSTGLERMAPPQLRKLPSFLRTIWEHSRQRDWFLEISQNFITDVDYCIECMRACPTGERWRKIRPT